MSFEISRHTPSSPLLAHRARARSPVVQAAAALADRRTVAGDQAMIQWAKSRFPLMQTATPAELSAMAAEAVKLRATPGLGNEAIALLWLAQGGAHGKLALSNVERKKNGQLAYQALTQAVALAPHERDVCQAYGRSMYGIAKRNRLIRWIVSKALGLDLDRNIDQALGLLAQFPNDPTSQVLRRRLAEKRGNRREIAEADVHIRRIAQHSPAAIEDAFRRLDGDEKLAKEAEKEAEKAR